MLHIIKLQLCRCQIYIIEGIYYGMVVSCSTSVCIWLSFFGLLDILNICYHVVMTKRVFCSGMKIKMAATAGLSLTLDPMGKMFQNAFSLKPLG
jgi:hypothetical protein